MSCVVEIGGGVSCVSCEYAHTFGAYIPVRVICACICVVSTHTLVLRHLCVVCVTAGSHVCTSVNTLVHVVCVCS